MPKTTLAFDLYGTILSTSSISTSLSSVLSLPGPKAEELAALWRRYQLEYTWRSNSMGRYVNFDTITRSSLRHVVHGIEPNQVESIMSAYDNLSCFPEIPDALAMMAENSNLVDAYVFSNGTEAMISASVNKSPDLWSFSSVFRGLISVDRLQRYKPDPKVYEYLVQQTSREDGGEVWLVSGNPFDVLGAKAAGLKAAWVDREGRGWADQLGSGMGVNGPDLVVRGVDEGVEKIIARAGGGGLYPVSVSVSFQAFSLPPASPALVVA
ncbi:HAD-like domain-containing protein [Triangularia setosa]|uniref:HAD-like domain-containing protein n=1 Tax=Triangularia setosa TaxID=2587417 RepID=A0AAN6W222_9PEZI|nr:HAD-like domain-containing protein [Podospora setosa]